MFWKGAQPSWDESVRNLEYGLMVAALVIVKSFLTVSFSYKGYFNTSL